MADTKISDLTALTAPASADLAAVVDVSDTTMAASGTTKRITLANLAKGLPRDLSVLVAPASTGWEGVADYTCDGTADEVEINSALGSLARSASGESLSVGTLALVSSCDATTGWSAVNSATLSIDTSIKRFGTGSLQITPPGTAVDPGASFGSLSLNLSTADYIDFWAWANQPCKLKITLTTTTGTPRVYMTRINAIGEWSRCLVPLINSHAGNGNLSSVTAIQIVRHIGESTTFAPAGAVFRLDAVGFSTRVQLANKLCHPGTFTVTESSNARTEGTDFEVNYRTGDLHPQPGGAIATGATLSAAYSHGGGTVTLLPGQYDVTSTAIQLRPWTTLEGHGAVIRQAAGFTGDGNLVRSYNTGRRLIGAAVRGVRFTGIRDEIGTTNSCRGVFFQNAEDCVVERCEFENLSGRALGCDRVGAEWNEGLSFRDNLVDRCGSEWVDIPGGVYQSLESSYAAHEPAVRLDYCRNFEVVCNTIRDGLGDNTQIKNCDYGRFSGNVILNARMGNWFIETCRHLVATDNVVDRAGSRGVTLEETSTHCVFTGNVVSRSGRENLWCNGSSYNTFSGNTFLDGGALRMSGGTTGDFANWNVRLSAISGTATSCVDNVLVGNVIDTDGTYAQAGLRVANDAGATIARNRVIGNAFLGTATPINDQGTQTLIAGNRDSTANGGWIVGASGGHDTTLFTPFEARGVGALLGFVAQIAGGSTATNSPQFKCSRDRGSTLGSPTNVSAGDRLLALLAGGYNSAASPLYYNTAALIANAKGLHATYNSGVIRLEVGQSSSAARVAGARVDELGLYARTLTAAPADGDLENNETVLYMNSTTPTLKRKDSGGTVTTIALT